MKGEAKNVREFRYTLEAKEVTWEVTGAANEAGVLTINIQDVPGALQGEEWRITKQQWSKGLKGELSSKEFEDMNTLQYGSKNNLEIEFTGISLEEYPTLTLTIQGPDDEEKSVVIDLEKACVEHLKEAISVEKQEALQNHHASVREKATLYQGNYAGAAREDAKRELGALYETTTSLQEQHASPLTRIAQSISVLRHSSVEDLSALDTLYSSMKCEVEALSTSIRILKPMISVLAHRTSGAIDPFSVLHDALQPRASDEVRSIDLDLHLDSPLLDVNKKGPQAKTLLHLAIEQGNIPLSQGLIRKGAEVNERDNKGKTPLQYAIAKRNQAAIALLQTSGAHQELPDKWQLQGRYDREHQQLTLSINNSPENMRTGAWHITGSTWSAGVSGQMPAHPTQIQYGDNLIPLNIEVATLTEAPSLKCVVQGPDNAFQTVSIDLTKVCVERMTAQETALSERKSDVERYVQETHTAYQIPQETVDHPGVNRAKQAEIETLLGRLTAFYTGYQENLVIFENNLTILERIQVNEHLPVFKKQLTSLEESIASLKSAQVQLQLKCTTAHDALFKTLEDGNVSALETKQAMETLLNDQHLDVNAKNEKEETFLHRSLWRNNVEIVRLLLDRGGVEVNARSNNGNTALHDAASRGNVKVAELLIEKGAEVKEKNNDGDTALHKAAYNGTVKTAELLIEKGAEVKEKNNDGDTALHKAALGWGGVEIAELLIEKGAEVKEKNNDGDTALHRAAYKGSVEVARLLIRAGAEVNENGYGRLTALHEAASEGKEEVVRLLIEEGAEVNTRDNLTDTALHRAAYKGSVEVARLLIRAGAEVNANGCGRLTALHKAASEGNEEVVRLLIKAGAEVNAKDFFRVTALMHAASSRGSVEIIELLLDRGAKVNERDNDGYTALGYAIKHNRAEIVRLLIERGAKN
jgi:ankyrin repeat protein